jgi:hypothetical protein
MLSKCANPSCNAPFQYLREGRLFKFDQEQLVHTGPQAVTSKKPVRRVEHFWLCADCATRMTVVWDKTKGVFVSPLRRFPVVARAASARAAS